MDNMNTMVTLYRMLISQDSYEAIKNFCEDFDIQDVPDRENMFIEVGAAYGIKENMTRRLDAMFLMDELELITLDSMGTKGEVVLGVAGTSPAIEQFILDFNDSIDPDDSVHEEFEPDPYVVISSNVSVAELTDVSYLGIKLNSYLDGVVYFEELYTTYHTADDLVSYVYDGKQVEED